MRSSNNTTGTSTYHDLAPKKKKRPGSLAKAYLVLYNILMTLGWFMIAVVLVRAYLAKRSFHGGYYDSVEKPLKVFQTVAILEILHSAVGIVPSSVMLTGTQVMSRVFVTWAVTHSVREVQSEASVLTFLTAWTVTEIIRYSYYTFSLIGRVPGLLKWARYSLFIVLYPMGVTGELLTMYKALPYVQRTDLYSVALSVKYLNVVLDYQTFLILTAMISYIPLFPRLYLHMLQQRKKVLGHAKDYKVE